MKMVVSAFVQFNIKGWKLTIGDLLPDDNGKYTCVISNEYGSINWTYTVEVMRECTFSPFITGLFASHASLAAVGRFALCVCDFKGTHPFRPVSFRLILSSCRCLS